MNRFALPALFALLLPGCPLTDGYYIEESEGEANRVMQKPQPYCGDGVIDSTEMCDGANLGEWSCATLGLGSGTLTCKADCRYDVSGCVMPMTPTALCGDGVAQGVEACDGADLLSQSCATIGLDSGTLRCTPNCGFDFSGCTPTPQVCGNGIAQGSEGCDGADLRGQTCGTLGLSTGVLTCTGLCSFDLTGCVVDTPMCSDGTADGTEACDGADLRGETCETLGFGPGTLSCTSGCGFDTTQCGSVSGCNATTAKAEVCDGVSNDCDIDVDEGGVCPENGRGATFGGHIYLLYLYASGWEGQGGQGWNGQQGGWNGADGGQQDYGAATTTCRAAGALLGLGVELDLARIESAEENDFALSWIAGATTEEGMVWMGANDLAEEARWVWGQDDDAVNFFTGSQRGGGTPVLGRFNDFSEGRPNSANNVDEDCGAFDSEYGWHWNDLDCSVPRLGVLCEQLD